MRLDQPYSRVADALLDKQFWAPDDPQKHPYDDTGWSFSQLFNVKVLRATDPAILAAKMTPVTDLSPVTAKLTGSGSIFAIANTGQSTLLSLLYKLKGAKITTAEKAFDSDGKHFAAGTLFIADVSEPTLTTALKDLSLDATRFSTLPTIAMHPLATPRIAFMHAWQATQTEGWWRYAFDHAGVPFDYISTQTASTQADLRSKYDVIVFAPVGRASTQDILNGIPMYGNPLPGRRPTSPLTLAPSTPPPTSDPASAWTDSLTFASSSSRAAFLSPAKTRPSSPSTQASPLGSASLPKQMPALSAPS